MSSIWGTSLAAGTKARTDGRAASRRFCKVTTLAVIVLLVGCRTAQLGPAEKIVQLNLITTPVALDLDDKPGADGISVKIYAISQENPKPIPIRQGSVDMLLFDGPFQRKAGPPPVLKEFRFSSTELRSAEFSSKIGTGYQVSLAWGTNLPTQRIMSVAARYHGPGGEIVISRPSSVTVLAK